jgi:hypothetical protein
LRDRGAGNVAHIAEGGMTTRAGVIVGGHNYSR